MVYKLAKLLTVVLLPLVLTACAAPAQEAAPTRTPRPLAGPIDASITLQDGSEIQLADLEMRYPPGFRTGGGSLWVAGNMLGLRDVRTVDLEPPAEIRKGIAEPYSHAVVTLIDGGRLEGTTLCSSMLGTLSSVYTIRMRSMEAKGREISLRDIERIELSPRQPITPPLLPDPSHDPAVSPGPWARVTNRMGETVLVRDPYFQYYIYDTRWRPVKVTHIVRRDIVLEGKSASKFIHLARIEFGARDQKLKDSSQTGQTVTLIPRKGKPRTGLFDSDGKGGDYYSWALCGEGPYGGYVMPMVHLDTIEFLDEG